MSLHLYMLLYHVFSHVYRGIISLSLVLSPYLFLCRKTARVMDSMPSHSVADTYINMA